MGNKKAAYQIKSGFAAFACLVAGKAGNVELYGRFGGALQHCLINLVLLTLVPRVCETIETGWDNVFKKQLTVSSLLFLAGTK
ncbi:hypothetical protein [Mucilaginibacter sp. HD30]